MYEFVLNLFKNSISNKMKSKNSFCFVRELERISLYMKFYVDLSL